MSEPETPRGPDRRLLGWVLFGLVAAAAYTFWPLWLPILLAAWFAHLTRPLVGWLERKLGGRRAVASSIVLVLLVVLLIPFTLATISLISSGVVLARRAMESPEWKAALQAIVSDGDPGVSLTDLLDPSRMIDLLRQHGAEAWSFLKSFFGVTADAVIQIFVFFMTAYAFLLGGAGAWDWLARRIPLERGVLDRLRGAFHETGRGIVVSIGLTALAQALVATISYAALGVPRPLALGQLTFFAAFIPSVGTALVWVPVAAALLITGEPIRALILALIGVLVIGTIDNLLRPVFSRWGSLDLPVYVLLLAIFGGFAVFGAWGFILGPLAVRLAREALDLSGERWVRREPVD